MRRPRKPRSDTELMRDLIVQAGFTVKAEVVEGHYRVTARDDAGHVQVVTADSELEALVELAERLGFEDMD